MNKWFEYLGKSAVISASPEVELSRALYKGLRFFVKPRQLPISRHADSALSKQHVSKRAGKTEQIEVNVVHKYDYSRTVGSLLGRPIYQSFKRQDDNTQFVFDRLAKCDSEGCPLDQVKKDEILLSPGLIYKKAS